MNLKLFDLMPRVSETRFLVQHESCKCKCVLNKSVSKPKQRRNHEEFWCECKDLGFLKF